ncbi:MAG: NADP-dependent oxidoreductase [Rhodococcus sp.]|nr:NADP-dependent oxidoreductase [Rhodococcus sp. (in: high G+C Gram-positive bacteria)]
MDAYVFTEYGGPRTQRFIDLPDPEPGPGQIQVQVRAAGVNPADWKVREGLRQATVETTFPAVLGREVAGVVTAVGSADAGFAVGDRVFGATAAGCGGYRRCTVLDAASTALIPDAVSFADAAVLPVAAGTAFDALHELDLASGQSLLVIGAGGGVGVAALQLAAARGLNVVGVASAAKRQDVVALGGYWVESGPDLASRLPRQVDAVLDLVGGHYLDDVADLVPGDRIVTTADVTRAKQLGGRGVTRRRTRAAFTELVGLVAGGVLDPQVRSRYRFADAGKALAAVETGHTQGKVVIEFE